MVFAPGEGRGGFRAGDCGGPHGPTVGCGNLQFILVWGEEPPVICRKDTKTDFRQRPSNIILNQDQPFGQLTLTG